MRNFEARTFVVQRVGFSRGQVSVRKLVGFSCWLQKEHKEVGKRDSWLCWNTYRSFWGFVPSTSWLSIFGYFKFQWGIWVKCGQKSSFRLGSTCAYSPWYLLATPLLVHHAEEQCVSATDSCQHYYCWCCGRLVSHLKWRPQLKRCISNQSAGLRGPVIVVPTYAQPHTWQTVQSHWRGKMMRASRQFKLHTQGNIWKKLPRPALTVGGRILQIPYLCTMGEMRDRKAIVSANSSADGSTTGASGGGWNILDVISLPALPCVMP